MVVTGCVAETEMASVDDISLLGRILLVTISVSTDVPLEDVLVRLPIVELGTSVSLTVPVSA
jgi:hypothetical protein